MEHNIKTQRLPIPGNEARLQEAVLLILRMPRLLELRITTKGLEVQRAVAEDELVVPETLVELLKGIEVETPDVAFLMQRLELEVLPLDPNRHQLTTLIEMTEAVRKHRLECTCWYVADGDNLDAFLAQAPGTLPRELFGLPVHYVPEDQLPEGKLLLVGSTTRHSIDSTFGVIADIGG